jgi:hypothetical protein
MTIEVRVNTVVLPGGKIEINRPEFISGQQVTVIVLIEEQPPVGPRHVIDIVASIPGHRTFQNAEEVDAYLREERNSWESQQSLKEH